MWGNKTLKREFAVTLVAMLLWQIFQGNTEMVEVIVWPIMTFAAGAAGMQIYEKVSNFTVTRSKSG